MPLTLYESPELYEAALGVEADDDEIAFYTRTITGTNRFSGQRLISMACGTARLEAPLSKRGANIVGFDSAPAMVAWARRRDRAGVYREASLQNPPDLGMSGIVEFDAAISGLLGAAYLTSMGGWRKLLSWLHKHLQPNAPLILDLPVCHKPARLQGVEESARGDAADYSFRYFDLLRDEEAFGVLATRIEVRSKQRVAARDAELAVFKPEGLASLLAEEGRFGQVAFHAPFELESACAEPPRNCRRSVVVARRSPVPLY